jgi:phosphatidate cytidylyltransferase
MLKTRILTVLVLLAVFLPALFWLPTLYWAGLVALLAAVIAWEWGALAGAKAWTPRFCRASTAVQF